MGGTASEDTLLVELPDTVWEPQDGFARVLGDRRGTDVVLGLFRARSRYLARSDVVSLDDNGRVLCVDAKPKQPISDLVGGCWVSRGYVLGGLRAHLEPGAWLNSLDRTGRIRGAPLSDSWLDIRTHEALEAAAR